ncbi:hypothetical protein D6D04_09658 [Aureobasidium pullulans]|nr:hypothetical protein D6D04_09658 [Aureobasidium pullulans]
MVCPPPYSPIEGYSQHLSSLETAAHLSIAVAIHSRALEKDAMSDHLLDESDSSSAGIHDTSSPRASSPVNAAASTGSTTARAASPRAPGGPATAIRRKAAADRADRAANVRPSSTRAAGAGGSSSTMLRLYTDESPGLKVDPFVVLVLSVGFIISVVALHILAKVTKKFSS